MFYCSEMAIQKSFDDGHAWLVVKDSAAVRGTRDNLQLHRSFDFLISAVQFQGLVHRHLRVLVSMNQQERRIFSIYVEDRTRQPGESRNIIRLTTEQQIKRGHTHAQAVR